MNNPLRTRCRFSLSLVCLLLFSIGLTTLQAGAGRTRPGGGGGGGGGRTHAAGRASYGHGGGYHHGGHYGYGGYYGHGYGYGYGYGHYYPYAWWHWGWATVPYYVMPYAFQLDGEAPGAIETDVRPKKASVSVDGEWLGQARDYNGRFGPLWLDPGSHELEFSREGYMTLRRTIDVRPGMMVRIDDRLDKGSGEDPRSDPRPAALPAPSVPSEQTSVTKVESETRSRVPRGLLRLVVEPADAAIYLDGEFLAHAEELSRLHGALPVASGLHRVEVVRPGYESQTLEVDVSGDEPRRVEIELKRKH